MSLSGGTLSLGDYDARVLGNGANYDLGEVTTSAGDMNGDGYADALVGIPGSDDGGENRMGAAYVYLGDGSIYNVGSTLTTAQADLEVFGAAASDELGTSVVGLGDIDGSGGADLAIGAQGSDGSSSNRGAVYVLLDPGSGSYDVADVATVTLSGNGDGDDMGYALGAVDLNGDGSLSLLVGNQQEDTSDSNAGAAHLFDDLTALSDNDVGVESDIWFLGMGSGDRAGATVEGLGDMNGDGINECAIGAPKYDSSSGNTGAMFVFYGLGS